jgi:hypothetical protein
MAEQRFGIFGKDVTRYIPPGLRPFAKAAVEMNPVTGFQRAGQALKEGDYTESAVETGILALPAGAYALRNVIKPSVTAGVDALKEMFLLGAADDVAKKAPAAKQGLSRREVLTGMGAAALAAPVGKGLVDLVPPAPVAKVAKVGLKGALGSAAAKAQKLRDLYFGANKVIKEGSSSPTGAVESLSQSMKIGEEMDSVTLSMNKDLDKVLKDAGDFSKFSDDELVAMAEMKLDISHMMRTGKGPDDFVRSGDPLRKEDVSKALDDAIDARGLRKQVRDLGLERMMQSIEAKRSSKPSAGTLDIDLPSDIIPKMLPQSGRGASLFPSEAKQGRQLLIVSCSENKCPDVGNMKALDRYTGMLFTKMKAEGIPPNVDIAILSAKHGLIRSDTPIEKYDQLMTPEIRDKFINDPEQMKTIRETIAGDYDKVFVTGGKTYRDVIDAAAGDLGYEVIKEKAPGLTQKAVVKKIKEAKGEFDSDYDLIKSYSESYPQFKFDKVYHYHSPVKAPGTNTAQPIDFEKFDMDVVDERVKEYSTSYLDNLGLHVGTKQAAKERFENIQDTGATVSSQGATFPLKADLSRPFENPRDPQGDGVWSEYDLHEWIIDNVVEKDPAVIKAKKGKQFFDYELTPSQVAISTDIPKDIDPASIKKVSSISGDISDLGREAVKKFRKKLADEGFTSIPYYNDYEDVGSVSHILLIDRPNKESLVSSAVSGQPMKDGGVAGLSDIARDMFKGPKGIGAYQPFMVG